MKNFSLKSIKSLISFLFISFFIIACDSGSSSDDKDATPIPTAKLTSIEISSNVSSIEIDQEISFSAQGIYSDGSKKELTNNKELIWNSSDPNIGSFKEDDARNVLFGKAIGSVKINATMNSITSNHIDINIASKLTNIDISATDFSGYNITSDINQPITFKAEGTYTNDERKDITSEVTWHSSESIIGSFDPVNKNIFTPSTFGKTNIKVTHPYIINPNDARSIWLNVVPHLKKITLSANNLLDGKLIINRITTLKAIGTFSDGNSQDITETMTWSEPSNNAIQIQANQITANQIGTASISGTSSINSNINSDPFSIEVIPVPNVVKVEIQSSELTNGKLILPLGRKTIVGLLATYDNQLTQELDLAATWKEIDPNNHFSIGDTGVNDKKVILTQKKGTASLKASVEILTQKTTTSFETAPIEIQVIDPALDKIEISPISLNSLLPNTAHSLNVKGVKSDGSQGDITALVTLYSSDPSIASINENQTIQTHKAGDFHIWAVYNNLMSKSIKASVVFDDTSSLAEIESIQIFPDLYTISGTSNILIINGDNRPFHVEGILNSGKKINLTHAVTWESAHKNIVSFNKNIAIPQAEGATQVWAEYRGKSTAKIDVLVEYYNIGETSLNITQIGRMPINEYSQVEVYLRINDDRRKLRDILNPHQYRFYYNNYYSTPNINNKTFLFSTKEINGVKLTIEEYTAYRWDENTISFFPNEIKSLTLELNSNSISKYQSPNYKVKAEYFNIDSAIDVTEFATIVSSQNPLIYLDNKKIKSNDLTGNTKIYAQYKGVKSNSIDISINKNTYTNINFSPMLTNFSKYGLRKINLLTNNNDELTDNISFYSSDPSVAFFTNEGILKAMKVGNVTLGAKIQNPDGSVIKKEIPVNIVDSSITNIVITDSSGKNGSKNDPIKIRVGEKIPLNVIGIDSTTGVQYQLHRQISWDLHLSNKYIISVDNEGYLIGKSRGKVKLKGFYNNQLTNDFYIEVY